MNKLKIWLGAFRLHTLPLSLASVILASLLALSDEVFNLPVFIFAAVTTLFLQILSNLANDLGDTLKGTDNEERLGPERTIQAGKISKSEMKTAILIISFLTLISGALLIYFGTKGLDYRIAGIFYALGILSIAAAINYTMGKKPYGYIGLGDFFVFVFFGLAGVIGTYFLHTNNLQPTIIFPAVAVGFLSVGVLNLNNLRDIENDKKSGKKTMAVRLGKHNAKKYHAFLIIGAVLCAFLFVTLHYQSYTQFLFVLSIPFLTKNLWKVFRYKEPGELIPELKNLALTTLLFTILWGVGMLI